MPQVVVCGRAVVSGWAVVVVGQESVPPMAEREGVPPAAGRDLTRGRRQAGPMSPVAVRRAVGFVARVAIGR